MGETLTINTMGTNAAEVVNEKSRLYGSFRKEGNALCYRLGAERLYITPWGENSFRVTSTKCAEMPKERWALQEDVPEMEADIRIEELQASITNGRIRAVVNNIGKIEYWNEKGELLLEEYLRNKNDMRSLVLLPVLANGGGSCKQEFATGTGVHCQLSWCLFSGGL